MAENKYFNSFTDMTTGEKILVEDEETKEKAESLEQQVTELNETLTQLESSSIQTVYLSSSNMQSLDDFVKATNGNSHGAFFRVSSDKILLPDESNWINGVVWYQNSNGNTNGIRGCAICKSQSNDTLYKVIIDGSSSAGYTANSYELIDANTCLKVQRFSVSLANLSWSSGIAIASIAVNMSNIVATIPVVESVTGYTLTCKQNTSYSSSLDTVECQVWGRDTSFVPSYGNLILYVFYT